MICKACICLKAHCLQHDPSVQVLGAPARDNCIRSPATAASVEAHFYLSCNHHVSLSSGKCCAPLTLLGIGSTESGHECDVDYPLGSPYGVKSLQAS